MSQLPAERRTQHAVMATASEWARIRELAADAGMDISRYIVHRATVPDPLPDSVLRRAVRELLLPSLPLFGPEGLILGSLWDLRH